jgi:DNA (cytosine-5)-methyltransferase 1
MKKLECLEIFAGCGGMVKGLEDAGFSHVGLVERDEEALKSLQANFPRTEIFGGDVRDFDARKYRGVDLVAGGPPCQPFSIGGRHLGDLDPRDMFPQAVRVIRETGARAFLFENVKGLLRKSFEVYLGEIENSLRWAGGPKGGNRGDETPFYEISHRLINSADFGVAQTRERVFIVGVGRGVEWAWPKGDHSLSRLLWEKFVTGEYWERHRVRRRDREAIPLSMKKRVEQIRFDHGGGGPGGMAWRTVRDVIGHLPIPSARGAPADHQYAGGAKVYPGHTGSDIDWPAKTIKAGGHGVPGGENMIRWRDGSVRYMSVYEAKLLQSLPGGLSIPVSRGSALRQIGNSAPSLLVSKIGRSISQALGQRDPLNLEGRGRGVDF